MAIYFEKEVEIGERERERKDKVIPRAKKLCTGIADNILTYLGNEARAE